MTDVLLDTFQKPSAEQERRLLVKKETDPGRTWTEPGVVGENRERTCDSGTCSGRTEMKYYVIFVNKNNKIIN